jgi:hypothetical protein
MSNQQELTPEGVLETIGYRNFVAGLFNRSENHALEFAHAILGIATELHELRRAVQPAHALEEMGDLAFYGEALYIVVQAVTGFSDADFVLGDDVDDWFGWLGDDYTYHDLIDDKRTELLDHAKRWIGYGKQPADFLQVLRDALNLVRFANLTLPGGPFPEWNVQVCNVAKLLHRYKGLKFNAEHAVNRDLSGEQAVIQHHAV